jgi:Predicted metal-binding, possibly nucleic acid-binding protein
MNLDVRAMDAFEFVRLRQQASGQIALADLPRFCDGLPQQPQGPEGMVQWSVRGEQGRHGEALLVLDIQARPVLTCQRCLAPFAWPVQAQAKLQLVRSEDELDDDEGMLDDDALDAPEKVLGSQRFDLQAQIEDELILSVPYIPKHEVCPGSTGTTQQPEDAQPARTSPFAVLEQLKSKK